MGRFREQALCGPWLAGLNRQQKSIRLVAGCTGLALLSACASSGPQQSAAVPTTDYYISHAAGNYLPPGPPGDPWGPYIHIAASRFDVPETWIRSVMHVESGGQEYIDGQLTVSPAGAMGLMQLEPETYQEMASRYGLDNDPFNPYNNIMAGTAYIHEMYEVYGSPGFLAAYNAGPGRLNSFMEGNRPLPHETTNYVAMIAPQIQGYYPASRSDADQLALNTLPASTHLGLLPPGESPGQMPARDAPFSPAPAVQLAALVPATEPESAVYAPAPALSEPTPVPPQPKPNSNAGFSLISSAMADTPPASSSPGGSSGLGWAIQVGAYNSSGNAKAALGLAELSAVQMLIHGQPMVVYGHSGSNTVYRARFVGLPHEQAVEACQRLQTSPTGCIILSPDAQS